MTGTQHITISDVCSLDESKLDWIIADEKSLQVCSVDNSKSESVIVNKSSTEESKSESVHKSINTKKEKDAINETEDEEP